MKKFFAGLDQSTTGTKFIIFDSFGKQFLKSYREHKGIFKHAGWIEHNPKEIWENTQTVIKEGMAEFKSKGYTKENLISLGITNQRETTAVWDKNTLEPLHNAIVWNDNRTEGICESMKSKYNNDRQYFKHTNGLMIAPYFSAFKLKWMFENQHSLVQKMRERSLAFGNMDTWVISNLTNGKSHVTDVTNASRTFMMNLGQCQWDSSIYGSVFGFDDSILPEIKPSFSHFGEITAVKELEGVKITGVLGDQQAAAFGLNVVKKGDIKVTYGTGCFLILSNGTEMNTNVDGLIGTVLYQKEGEKPNYAIEGALSVGAANLNWLKDQLKGFENFNEMNELLARRAVERKFND